MEEHSEMIFDMIQPVSGGCLLDHHSPTTVCIRNTKECIVSRKKRHYSCSSFAKVYTFDPGVNNNRPTRTTLEKMKEPTQLP